MEVELGFEVVLNPNFLRFLFLNFRAPSKIEFATTICKSVLEGSMDATKSCFLSKYEDSHTLFVSMGIVFVFYFHIYHKNIVKNKEEN